MNMKIKISEKAKEICDIVTTVRRERNLELLYYTNIINSFLMRKEDFDDISIDLKENEISIGVSNEEKIYTIKIMFVVAYDSENEKYYMMNDIEIDEEDTINGTGYEINYGKIGLEFRGLGVTGFIDKYSRRIGLLLVENYDKEINLEEEMIRIVKSIANESSSTVVNNFIS